MLLVDLLDSGLPKPSICKKRSTYKVLQSKANTARYACNEQMCLWLRENVWVEGQDTEWPEHTSVGMHVSWALESEWMTHHPLPSVMCSALPPRLLCAHVACYPVGVYQTHPRAWQWSDLDIPTFQAAMRAHQSLLRGVRGRRVREQGDGKKVADSDCNSLLLSGGVPPLMAFSLGEK